MSKKKKKNPTKKTTRTSARRKANPRRRLRRNPDGAVKSSPKVSIGSIVAGVVGGGILAGAADYLLAGTSVAATPTRRALIDGGATLALGAVAAATGGFARGAAAGAAGAFGGLAVANVARVIGEASLSKSSSQSSTTTKGDTPTVTLDQGAMHGLLLPGRRQQPMTPKARQTGHMSAVVLDRTRMRALVVDPTAAMQAARRAGVTPAMLEPPRMVRATAPGGRMGQLIVRGISR